MKNRLKIITAIMLTLIFCMQPVCNVQATEESNLSEAQQEKKTLENDLQKAKELIDSLKGSKEDIQSEVEKLDKQLNEISGKVKELESRLSKKRQEIADTESALNKAKEQEKKQYRNMKKRIQFMYENGQTSYVEMLLSADSFTDFLNAVEYITQISQYDRKMLKEYQNMQVTIADTQKTLETDYASLQSLQAKVQEEKQAVAALESAKKGELNDVADDLTDAGSPEEGSRTAGGATTGTGGRRKSGCDRCSRRKSEYCPEHHTIRERTVHRKYDVAMPKQQKGDQ